MNLKEYSQPHMLERYSFLWSEGRLFIAALALFIGGVPPLLAFNPFSFLYGILKLVLVLAWVISGATSGYLLYRWNTNQKMLFGGKEKLDTAAFLISVVSGINLGVAGILGINLGMTVFYNYFLFMAAAILYVASAVHLYKRWKESGEKLF